MPNLLALSLDGELSPSFDLRCLTSSVKPPDGLGIGYYPGGEASANVLKDHAPAGGNIVTGKMKPWEHLESSLFVVHVRTATWGAISTANTQPFLRSHGRRDWLFAHSGSLQHPLELPPGGRFEPVGSTDSERIFCDVMSRMAEKGWASLGEADPSVLREWLASLSELGRISCVLTDGRDLLAYADPRDAGIHLGTFLPPYEELGFSDADMAVNLTRPGNKARKGVIVSSGPLAAWETQGATVSWRPLFAGHLVLIRQGVVRAEAGPPLSGASSPGPALARSHLLLRPSQAAVKRFEVRHQTRYRYSQPVERSMHLLRLAPAHDRFQTLLSSDITLSVEGRQRDYEDVFGNRVRRVMVETPFTELTITSRAQVELLDTDPLSFHPLRAQSTIPLTWMPWHRQVLQPFLLPPELPESQLHDLIDYAMSFVSRNDSDLLDTLLDINTTLFREYAYRQGATTVHTTPFEVFTNRYGVCQDFTNLFICLARLLGVPARYVCGYIYTGAGNANQRQSEASHAWAQVYLPEVGWRGFDPTNGVLTQTDHIRVATGRNYVDATPTSGTLFVGGGGETLDVEVRVSPL